MREKRPTLEPAEEPRGVAVTAAAGKISVIREPAGTRLRQLDALRGIAAVSVMLHHYVWVRVDTQLQRPHLSHGFWLMFKLLHPMLLGHEAVMLFFVLSGMVLTSALERRTTLAYPGYVAHRAARIYLPYMAVLLLCIAGSAWCAGHIPTWTPWLAGQWAHVPDRASILQHVLFLGFYKPTYNAVCWSLIVEMRVSLVLPFLVMFFRRLSFNAGVSVAAVATLVDVVLLAWAQQHLGVVMNDVLGTVHYAVFFIYGILIALHRSEIQRRFLHWQEHLGLTFRLGFFAASVLSIGYLWGLIQHLSHWNVDFVAALGGAGLIVSAMYCSRFARVLQQKQLLWLGKISFSLYLLHMPVVLVLSTVAGAWLSYPVLALLAIAISLLLAQVLVRSVEQPSQLFGRWLDTTFSTMTARWRLLPQEKYREADDALSVQPAA